MKLWWDSRSSKQWHNIYFTKRKGAGKSFFAVLSREEVLMASETNDSVHEKPKINNFSSLPSSVPGEDGGAGCSSKIQSRGSSTMT